MKKAVKIKTIIFFFLYLVLCLFGFSQQKFIDDLGSVICLSSSPKRIISLAPNITEVLFALGLEKQIIGVTRYCNYPPQAQLKEKIGGMIDINFEKIKYLNPDLVFAFRGNRLEAIKRLKELRIKVFVLNSGSGIEETFSLVRKIGLVTFREKEANKLIESLKRKYMSVMERLSLVNNCPKVFLSLHGQGLWTCGKRSFLHDLIVKAKGKNIAEDISQAWVKYNKEELIFKNPEVIIILTKSEKDFQIAKSFWFKNKVFNGIKAIEDNRIFYINEDLLSRPGPRLIEGFVQLAKIVHPEVFFN